MVGAGGSGMRAALELARGNLKVAVLSKVFPTRSHTVAAQGGIAAPLANSTEDNWHWHMYDTVKGADYLGDQDAIEYMCRRAVEVVVELEHMGMPFDRIENGKIYQRPFGGHTQNYGSPKMAMRACAAADRTGHAMLHTLYQQNVRANTQFFVEWMALDLIIDPQDGACVGVVALEMETGEINILQAKATLLATGGGGRIYWATTNAFINTGDGLGMVARAGLPLEDMEFWQFHPTGVAGAGVLITEGVRGEGGYLLNKRRRALHGALCAQRQGPGEPRRGVARHDHRDQGRPRLRRARRLPRAQALAPQARGHHQAPARASARSRSSSPTSTRSATTSPWCRRCTTRWAAFPTNYMGQVVVPEGASKEAIVPGLYAAGRVRLRLGAWRQSPRHQLVAGPAGVRQGLGRAGDQGHPLAAEPAPHPAEGRRAIRP